MKTVDCRNMYYSHYKNKRALKKANSGETIKVVTDHSCVFVP